MTPKFFRELQQFNKKSFEAKQAERDMRKRQNYEKRLRRRITKYDERPGYER